MGYASHVAVKALDKATLQINQYVSYALLLNLCNRIDARCSDDLSLGIALYYAQLGLNVIWSPLFFEHRQVRTHHSTVVNAP
jgi:benzodiazapine receptor